MSVAEWVRRGSLISHNSRSKPGLLNIHGTAAKGNMCVSGTKCRNNTRGKRGKAGGTWSSPRAVGALETHHWRENKLRLLSKLSVGKSRRLCLFATCHLTVKSFIARRINSEAALEQRGPLCYSLWHLRLIMFSGLIQNESILPVEDKDRLLLQGKIEK